MPWVVLTLLAAEPGYGPPVDSHVAWVNLAPTVVALSTGTALVAAGIEVPLNARLSLTFEATGHVGGRWIYDCATNAGGGWLSVGLTVRPLERFRGFFVQPKLNVHSAYSSGPRDPSVTEGCPSTPSQAAEKPLPSPERRIFVAGLRQRPLKYRQIFPRASSLRGSKLGVRARSGALQQPARA